MIKKYPKYKNFNLKSTTGKHTEYVMSVYAVNKKSISCKIAKNGNFDPCTKKLNVKIQDGKILFVFNFESVDIKDLELIDD